MTALVLEAELAPGIVQLTLNRPAQRNALDGALIEALGAALRAAVARAATRAIVVAAAGTSFCAGADLDAMLALGRGPRADNLADAGHLAGLLRAVRDSPKPVLACVQGPAFGGGLGLVAACDIALASTAARFRLPEVTLGLVPAVISPYVIEAIGLRQARRYFLSAEPIAAERARELGLVHEVTAPAALAARTLALAQELCAAGPNALAIAKSLIAEVGHSQLSAALGARTAEILVHVRSGAEAQEGLAAALARRAPAWKR
jgi:methylglutaconyl-CoA hydratase